MPDVNMDSQSYFLFFKFCFGAASYQQILENRKTYNIKIKEIRSIWWNGQLPPVSLSKTNMELN